MTDLALASSTMDDLRRTFTTITGRLDGARRALANTDHEVVGAQSLADRLHGFASGWKYGISQIGQHSDSTVKMIDGIGKTFDQADIELANTLQKAGGNTTAAGGGK